MMKQMIRGFFAVLFSMVFLTGCVDQHPETTQEQEYVIGDSMIEDTAVLMAKEKVVQLDHEPRIIATSVATAQICERLNLNLVGVCSSSISEIPDRYKDVPTIGTSMAPDMEVIASLSPDWILGPVSLQTDLQPKYENLGVDWAFLNLNSVTGMYRSVEQMGEIFGRQEQAQVLVKEFHEFYQNYQQEISGKEKPKVMILMGLPGSYVIATPKSYVGSLVEMPTSELDKNGIYVVMDVDQMPYSPEAVVVFDWKNAAKTEKNQQSEEPTEPTQPTESTQPTDPAQSTPVPETTSAPASTQAPAQTSGTTSQTDQKTSDTKSTKVKITVKSGSKKVSKITIKRKKTKKLTIVTDPKNASVKLAKLSGKAKKIAKVSLKKKKLTIKGKKKGSIKIKLTSGKTTKTLKITVK